MGLYIAFRYESSVLSANQLVTQRLVPRGGCSFHRLPSDSYACGVNRTASLTCAVNSFDYLPKKIIPRCVDSILEKTAITRILKTGT